METYENIEKVKLQNKYNMIENPGVKLTKYLVNLKAVEHLQKMLKKQKR